MQDLELSSQTQTHSQSEQPSLAPKVETKFALQMHKAELSRLKNFEIVSATMKTEIAIVKVNFNAVLFDLDFPNLLLLSLTKRKHVAERSQTK